MPKYLFVGNRYYVFKKMLDLGCNITERYVVKGSYLEQMLKGQDIPYNLLPTKAEFINILHNADFDILVSNGCPYILPISQFDSTKKFINIHPSLLPDLRGKNPVNGAILFGRKHGVTCHYMNDAVDRGDIISQIEIPITEDMDLDLLYQISFISEGSCFEAAWKRGFLLSDSINSVDSPIYYTRKDTDMVIHSTMATETILNVVRAFKTRGQYAKVVHPDHIYNIQDAKRIINPYIKAMYSSAENNMVLLSFGKKCLVKLNGNILQLELDCPMETGEKFFDE